MEIESITDEKLIEIIREKDSELYCEIMKRYKNKLSNYLFRFLKDKDEIDDVLQNIFIKVYKNLYGFNVEKKFSSWIYRIAHNEALNHIKKYKKEKTPIEEIENKVINEKNNMVEDMDRQLLKKEMNRCLDKLKIKYSEPLILFYFEEKSYNEISDILRIPKSTVGTLITRGKKMMFQIIEQNK